MAAVHDMEISAASDIITLGGTSLPSDDEWTSGYFADSKAIKPDDFYCRSSCAVVHCGFTNDAACTVESNSASSRLLSDTVGSSTHCGGLTVAEPCCWSSVSTGQATASAASSLSHSESTSLSSSHISHHHPFSTVAAVERNFSLAANGMILTYAHFCRMIF